MKNNDGVEMFVKAIGILFIKSLKQSNATDIQTELLAQINEKLAKLTEPNPTDDIGLW